MAKLTTLGVVLAYGIEVTPGQKPATFTLLDQCSEIGEINLSTENIDVSDLSNYTTEYASGRQDTGGNWDITFIMDPSKSIPQIKKLYADSAAARKNNLATWFEVIFPDMDDAFFVIAQTGNEIPLPAISQNTAATIGASLIINQYKGLDTKIVPQQNTAGAA